MVTPDLPDLRSVPSDFAPSYPNFLACVHPDDRQMLETALQRAIEGVEPYDIDHRIVRPSGEVRILHAIGEVEFAPDGSPLRMLGVVSDVTEARARAATLQTELAEINQISAMAEDIASVGHWRYVISTQARTWSPSTFAIFGLDPADGPRPRAALACLIPRTMSNCAWRRRARRTATPTSGNMR
uniref:histidine kinase n=1 Tax=Phenylobacterium glaciei TaxID=2803784 RepID=A0A974S9E8_9CAUL|nr:PAS domain-containing protein [Phenylobacterium glaciei]